MPRIRSIKPETARDAKLAKVSREARCTFFLLLTQVDDAGYFDATPRSLLGALYPHDPDVSEWTLTQELDALRERGILAALDSPDGIIGRMVNFLKHQKIDHPSRSHFASLSLKPRATFANGVLSLEVLSPESTPPPPPPAREDVTPWPEFPLPDDPTEQVMRALPLPEDREAFQCLLRASGSPGAFASTVRALGPGGIEQAGTWAQVGQALRDLATDGKPNAALLRGFLRRVKEPTPERNSGRGAHGNQLARNLAAIDQATQEMQAEEAARGQS